MWPRTRGRAALTEVTKRGHGLPGGSTCLSRERRTTESWVRGWAGQVSVSLWGFEGKVCRGHQGVRACRWHTDPMDSRLCPAVPADGDSGLVSCVIRGSPSLQEHRGNLGTFIILHFPLTLLNKTCRRSCFLLLTMCVMFITCTRRRGHSLRQK